MERENERARASDEILLLSDKLQHAEEDIYRSNKEKQAQSLQFQHDRHAFESVLLQNDAKIKSLTEIEISLTKQLQRAKSQADEQKRLCEELVERPQYSSDLDV